MRVLLIGLGSIGQRHIRNMRSLLGPEAEFIAHRTRRETAYITPSMETDSKRNIEAEFAIQVFEDLGAALERQPHLAFVCNPSNLHIPAASACVRCGCDVFIEKPLSHSLEGTAELVREAKGHNRIVMVGYQWRFHPSLKKLAEIIQEKQLGTLLAVRAMIGEYLPKWHPYEDYRRTYAARKDLGGGVVVTQIHEYDYLYSLFGLPDRVYAIGGHWSGLDIDVEDTASVLMTFRTENRPLPVHLHQDYLQCPPSRECEVIGDRGRAIMDLRALSVTVFRSDSETPEVHSYSSFERNQLFLDELSHFLECVKTRRKPVVDLEDGLQSLRMALAAKESMATGLPVDLKSYARKED